MMEKFARHPLTFGPTPIEKLNRLGAHLGGKVELYDNREDCNSGLAFGGNKPRKLEYIVPDAIASNADTLVSIGGVQSNHNRMVAAVAAKIGMKCHLVQESWVPHEDAVYDRVGNIMLSRIIGPTSGWSTKASTSASARAWSARSRRSRRRAASPTRSRPAPRCSRLLQGWPCAPRHWHRRIGYAETDQGTGARDRTQMAPALLRVGACSATEPPE
jgi:1-aminocyclopropane-1-carboxylate deaminase